MSMIPANPIPVATAAVLAGIGGLHLAWGLGSTFPFPNAASLADTVAGTQAVPRPAECFGVAALLTGATILVGSRVLPTPLRRVGAAGVAAVLAGRGVLGVTGRTHQLVGWSTSPRFVERDRRVYGPLCLALAAGALVSLSD